MNEEKDPSELSEDLRELIEQLHKDKRESRPDEGWRIKSMEKPESIAPYKKDEEEVEGYAEGGMVDRNEPGIQDATVSDFLGPLLMGSLGKVAGMAPEAGRAVMDPDADIKDLIMKSMSEPSKGYAKGGMIPGYDDGGTITDDQAMDQFGQMTGSDEGSGPNAPAPVAKAPMATPNVPQGTSPMPTDQNFMDKANKMLGLTPEQQAGFMKLLGNNAQKGQIGAGIAGIGDAIASGGTLGKVNPGALNKSEDMIQNKEKQGIEGMQTIRGNQKESFELGQTLRGNEPFSPEIQKSLVTQFHIPPALSGAPRDVIYKMLDPIAQTQLKEAELAASQSYKTQALDLQKKQLEATIGNQKAEREAQRQNTTVSAAKALADKGAVKSLVDLIPFTAGHAANKVLEKTAMGGDSQTSGPVAVNSHAEYAALPSGTHYVDSHGTEKVKK